MSIPNSNVKNTTGFYGDLEGIMGAAALPSIKALELPGGEDEGA